MIQCGVWEALERRAAANRKKITDRSLKDFEFLSGQKQKLIKQWCFPVLGFNSRCYDLKLIKKHLVTKIAQADNMKVATKLMMFLSTESKFLHIMNYLGPGTSYAKWVQTYGAELAKSWLPYEWFDTAKKLDFPG